MAVAFDAATDAQEIGGDAVISLTHTSTGADRAVFAHGGNSDSVPLASTSITYGGTSMTEMWDITVTNVRGAGYRLAGQATGAQTVTQTLAGSAGEKVLSVVSMTGVDATTPVGTAVTTTVADAIPATPSVTVGTIGSDDLVVDGVYVVGHTGNTEANCTAGADQTERAQDVYDGGSFSIFGGASTQIGTAGGVMSWSLAQGSFGTVLGAVAFKPAAAVAAPPVIPRLLRRPYQFAPGGTLPR